MKFLVKCIYVSLPLLIFILYYCFYHSTGNIWSAQCLFYQKTGILCPGCGGQRAFDALIHGEFIRALRMNALVYLIVPYTFCLYVLMGVHIIWNKNILTKIKLVLKIGGILILLMIIFL